MIEPAADPRGATSDPWVGRVLEGKYRVLRPMSEGGMGAVYVGEHVRLRRKVAIKLLHPRLARDPRARRRFEGEARAAAEITHPGIVEVLDFGEAEADTYFLVMELLEGHDLDAEMRAGPLSPSRATSIAREVCGALEAIHARGVVHRDLKPANIFLARDGPSERVKVLDFGVAKLTGSFGDLETAHTATGQAIGTPVYMSPEQARGLRDVDHRTDLYALGVILFEALTGQALFEFTNTPDLLLQICHGRVPRLRERRPDLPQALDDVIHRLLARQATDRFASASEVSAALAPFTTGGLGEAVVAPPREDAAASTLLDPGAPPSAPAAASGADAPAETPPTPRRRRRGRAVGVALGALVAGALVTAVVLVARPAPEAAPPAAVAPPALAPPGPVIADPLPDAVEPAPTPTPAPVEPPAEPAPAARARAAPNPTRGPGRRGPPAAAREAPVDTPPPAEAPPPVAHPEPPPAAEAPARRDIFRLPVP